MPTFSSAMLRADLKKLASVGLPEQASRLGPVGSCTWYNSVPVPQGQAAEVTYY